MSVFDRLRRSNATITAAAERIEPEDLAGGRSRRSEPWQDEVWRYYEDIPEVWFATNYIANALRRVRLIPATQPDPEQPPVLLSPDDGAVGARANAELDRLRDRSGTHGSFMFGSAMHMTIPGEGQLALYIDEEDGSENCVVATMDELRNEDGKWILKDEESGRDGEELVDPIVSRMWRPHPRFRKKPDSPMRSLRKTLEELTLLDRNARGAAKSRIPNGLYLIPDEINFKRDPRARNKNGHGYSSDPFVDEFIHMGITPMKDEDSAAAALPGVLKVKGALIDQFHYQTFGRSFAQEEQERYQVLLRRFAIGMDLPMEVVTGIQDMNHWNAWMIPDESFRVHLAPLVELICANATEVHLAPALEDIDQNVIVWYDASALTSHAARGSEADNAMRLGALSFEAYRRYKGYSEADAATEDDLKLLERLMVGKPGQPGSPGEPGAPQGAALIAAVSPAASRGLARELAAIDKNLRLQLQAAAHSATWRALDKVGAKMRDAALKHPELTSLLVDVSDRDVCSILGPERVKQLASDDVIIEDAAAPVIPLFGSLVSNAQKRVLAIARQYGYEDLELAKRKEISARQDADRERGAEVLTKSLTNYIGSVVFAPDKAVPAESQGGEYTSLLNVPPGIIREALSVAGGGAPSMVTRAAVTAGLKANIGVSTNPMGGVATGDTVVDMMQLLDLAPTGYMWVYGDEGARASFPGHLELNEVEFLDWFDPALVIHASDAWLGTEYYFPGDHVGCQCDYAPIFTPIEP